MTTRLIELTEMGSNIKYYYNPEHITKIAPHYSEKNIVLGTRIYGSEMFAYSVVTETVDVVGGLITS